MDDPELVREGRAERLRERVKLTPVPLTVMDFGDDGPLCVTVTEPFAAPAPDGANTTLMVQLALFATVVQLWVLV